MSCPTTDTWLRLSARDLDGDDAAALRAHAQGCDACGRELRFAGALQQVAGPTPAVDVSKVVRGALQRTETPRAAWRAKAVALAAGLALVWAGVAVWQRQPNSEFTGRGSSGATWSSRVAIELRPLEQVQRSVVDQQALSSRTRWAVWYRNVESSQPVYAMAYIVDAAGELHWLVPAYRTAGVEPAPQTLPLSTHEALLGELVELEGAVPGPAELVTVINRAPGSVLALEGSDRATRHAPELLFPDSVVWRRHITLTP